MIGIEDCIVVLDCGEYYVATVNLSAAVRKPERESERPEAKKLSAERLEARIREIIARS